MATYHTAHIHRLVIPVIFPAGIAPGSQKDGGNLLELAQSNTGTVLRGTSIAGVLRHAYARHRNLGLDDEEVTRWFGLAADNDPSRQADLTSPLRVADAVLDVGKGETSVRNHNSIDRHTGAVRDGGLFSIEALPPGTRARLVLHLHARDNDSDALSFLQQLLAVFQTGLSMGGHSARGIGVARIDKPEKATYRAFDLESLDGHAAWLDESWKWRSGEALTGGVPLEAAAVESTLTVHFELVIPRGQDICIGDDVSLDFQMDPQRVRHADGKEYWKIPGSSLRGVVRAWVTRLAARAATREQGAAPADSVQAFDKRGRKPARGDDIAYGLMDKDQRVEVANQLREDPSRLEELVPCPVMQLFGSLFNASRIQISDCYSTEPVSTQKMQGRKHVAVDRITGGASEGFLFDHRALLAGVRFEGSLRVQSPKQREARWLADTLCALDLGVLRVGSSKSSGRLTLAEAPKATGEYAGMFTSLKPAE